MFANLRYIRELMLEKSILSVRIVKSHSDDDEMVLSV